MSRRHPRHRSGRPVAGSHPPAQQVESWPDGDWVVRLVTGSASTKPYRCPGCDHEIRPATPHVVVWPADPADPGGAGDARLPERRHWHRACWRARDRRR